MTAYDLTFTGDKPEEGDDENYERIHGQLKHGYFNLMENAEGSFSSRNVNKANIIASDNPENFQIYDNDSSICIVNKSSGVVKKYNYNVNKLVYF